MLDLAIIVRNPPGLVRRKGRQGACVAGGSEASVGGGKDLGG